VRLFSARANIYIFIHNFIFIYFLKFSFSCLFAVPSIGKTDIDLQTHSFVVPKKEITSPADIASKWEKSEVSFFIAAYIEKLELMYKLYL